MSSVQPDVAEVERELARILESAPFRGSRRSQEFLRYVVRRTLEGDGESLKERTLAVEIFGRKAGADLGDDSIVRVGAREVRKRLSQFYVTEGEHDRVRIELPAGSYVPSFEVHGTEETAAEQPAAPPAAPPEATMEDAPAGIAGPSRTRQRIWLTFGAVITATILAAAWTYINQASSAFETFWAPVLEAKTVDIALESPQNLAPGQYAGIGETMAAARVFSLCERRNRAARIEHVSKLEAGNLRDGAVVLVGGRYADRWTLQLARHFRFRMGMCGERACIVDTVNHQEWLAADGRSGEDYILIGRLPGSAGGGTVVLGGGLTENGTAEAGRILTSPDVLGMVLAKLPAGWKDHNFLILLHSRVVGDGPAPVVIAHQIW